MLKKGRFTTLMFLLSFLVLGFLTTSSFADQELVEYNPQLHVYVEGMEQGVMKDHVTYGTLDSINGMDDTIQDDETIIVPIFNPKIQPESVEQGSRFYPRAWPTQSGDAYYPSNVRWNSCGGGDDAWVDYYYINENYLWNNKLRVWADNLVSRAHIVVNNGLHGGYYCVGGYCTISVCSTQASGSNPWSVFLLRLYN